MNFRVGKVLFREKTLTVGNVTNYLGTYLIYPKIGISLIDFKSKKFKI
jgi:hypothetical protein